jgi:hypothetical protein
MSDCCLTNLGCLQIPSTVIGSQGQAGANGSVWLNGSGNPLNTLGNNGDYYINIDNGQVWVKAAGSFTPLLNITGGTGAQGSPGFTRVAYNLPDILSGSGGTSTPKVFITKPVNAVDMPQTQGSSLVLTFNIRNEFDATFLSTLQYIGVYFGGVPCINGSYLINNILISKVRFFEAQVKIEVIRGIDSTVGYSRVSFIGVDPNGVTLTYTESNPLTGLNFGLLNSFEIRGKQVFENGFRFSTLTVDKIIAQ